MRILKFVVFVVCCFVSVQTFAQSPREVEADLLKSFKRIDDAFQKANNDTTGDDRLVDKITTTNDTFTKKLLDYTAKSSFTISYPFLSLKKEHLDISTSADGLFRIYSWDTETGGTMHYFQNVFQYKQGERTFSVLDTAKETWINLPNYNKVYTFKVNNKTYYLAAYLTISSTKDVGNGIRVFSIENGKLNQDTKVIKTATGMHSQLEYNYNFFYVVDWKVRPSVYFDAATKSIYVPFVDGNGKVAHKFIIYKFTGKYFEKVKS
jgi:hypothetical protein